MEPHADLPTLHATAPEATPHPTHHVAAGSIVSEVGDGAVEGVVVQRDGPFTLTMPSMQRPQPTDSPLAPGLQLQMNDEVRRQQVEAFLMQQLQGDALLRLAMPHGAPAPAAQPAWAQATPPPIGGNAPAGTATGSDSGGTSGGDAAAAPKGGAVSDVIGAVLQIYEVQRLTSSLQQQALDRVRIDWSRLRTGEQVGVVTAASMIVAPTLGAMLANPSTRQIVLDQINGRVIPVPGAPWLGLEVNLHPNSTMVGLHLDIGRMLPRSFGFGPADATAIGGPPQPQEFVPGPPVQRSASSAASAPTGHIGKRIRGASAGGLPLEPAARGRLERGLKANLSNVRIHQDAEADRLSQSVAARAFTTGQHIFFRQGTYAPDTSEGLRLLAHEVTHTVQQASGAVKGAPAPGGIFLSHPSDSHEQAAAQSADAIMAGRTPTTVTSRGFPAPGAGVPVQRFQAGDAGHGMIEANALGPGGAGFTAAQARQIYQGNWLRDYSQLTGIPGIMPILQTLALGEFGHEIPAQQFGTYVPSEHLDNPQGGDTIETSTNADPRNSLHFHELSSAQQQDQIAEYEHRAGITAAANASGLPEYIERGKYHSKSRLQQALTVGQTDEGMRLMGDGLHAVEDYFSHSNFVEVAISQLSAAGQPVAGLMGGIQPGVGAAGGTDSHGRAGIVTGTYGTGNSPVSLLETLRTELASGPLRRTFVLGYMRQHNIEGDVLGDMIGRGAAAQVSGIAGIAAGAGGGLAGGVRGAYEGITNYRGLGNLASQVASGAASGAHQAAVSQERAVDNAGGALGRSLESIVDQFGVPTIVQLFPGIQPVLSVAIGVVDRCLAAARAEADRQLEGAANQLTQVAGGIAVTHGWGMTHSEIAKDDTSHPLFALSIALAQHVDELIGREMRRAWESHDTSPDTMNQISGMVDTYVSHPSTSPWWRDIVVRHASRGSGS